MNSRRPLLVALMLASLAAIAVPSYARDVDVYLNVAPPPPRYEVVPGPRYGHVWVPGYWDWRGHRHVWISGHWERVRHGHRWHESRWVERDGRWYLERGGWRRDSDGDGIPDRYDRHPNNPYRP